MSVTSGGRPGPRPDEYSPGGGLVQPLLTPEDVAQRLNVKVSWVYGAAQRKVLPSVKVGRWVRFRHAEIEAFVAQGGASE